MVKSKVDKLSLELVRNSLALVTLEDIEDKEQDESDRKEYCRAIAAVYPRLSKDIKGFLHKQLIKTSMQSETWEQTLVGRGVFAGFEILLGHWEKANAEHLNQAKSKEVFDPHDPIGRID